MMLLMIPVIIFFAWVSVCFRLAILHPANTLFDALRDSWFYLKHRAWRRYDGGKLNCYFAHFGGGKTLSMVHDACRIFRRYNNRYVWDRGRHAFVLQKVHIISNVNLTSVPFEELVSLSQVVCCAWRNKEVDEIRGTRTVVLVLLDEASSQLNSRNFKTNIDADFLNTLITSRHFHMSLFYTSQKFKLVDALLRSVTQRAIWCRKIWRFMVNYYYDADELEYATNPTLVQPRLRTGFYIHNADYSAYDTLATVSKLQRAVDSGDMLDAKEILELRGSINPDVDAVSKPSRRLLRFRKK